MSLLLQLFSVAEQNESAESVSALKSIVETIRQQNEKLYQQISGPPQTRGVFAKLSLKWIQDVIHESEPLSSRNFADETPDQDTQREEPLNNRAFIDVQHSVTSKHPIPLRHDDPSFGRPIRQPNIYNSGVPFPKPD